VFGVEIEACARCSGEVDGFGEALAEGVTCRNGRLREKRCRDPAAESTEEAGELVARLGF
jgi:hypothetical protein